MDRKKVAISIVLALLIFTIVYMVSNEAKLSPTSAKTTSYFNKQKEVRINSLDGCKNAGTNRQLCEKLFKPESNEENGQIEQNAECKSNGECTITTKNEDGSESITKLNLYPRPLS